MTNHVTIFSNGVADYRKVVQVTKDNPTSIRIPVNKNDVGDVLASLTIFGKVTYTPPTFSPSNDQDGTLDLRPQDVLKQLASELRGANAEVTTSSGNEVSGSVVGLHDEPKASGETSVNRTSLVLLVNGKFQSVELQDIKEWQFTDAQVQIEIQKALQRAFQDIKPESTFVESSLSTKEDSEEAVVQYTTSAAAWKITYRLRQVDGETYLEGFAVVDNNTEEDWEDVIVSVVVGEPISFRTDLAHVTVPHRNTVQVVQSRAVGAVEAEEAMNFANVLPQQHVQSMAATMPVLEDATMAMDDDAFYGGSFVAGGESASNPQTIAREVGDYCVFESLDLVTIRSKWSALVPVFKTTVPEDQSKLVLYYKPSQHPERAYRTIQFTNSLDHSLGRGVCTLYRDRVTAGTAIMPATKQGQQQLLPHALDTGVKFRKEDQEMRTETIAAKVSKGVAVLKNAASLTTTYQVKNHKPERHEVALDHSVDSRLKGRYGVSWRTEMVSLETNETTELDPEKLKDGLRYTFNLAPNQEVLVTVRGTVLQSQDVSFGDSLNLGWFLNYVVVLGGEFKDNEQIQTCIEVQQKIDRANHRLELLQEEHQQLVARQGRLQSHLATHPGGEAKERWTHELVTAENRLVEIEETERPSLNEEEEKLEQELCDALKKVVGSWEKS